MAFGRSARIESRSLPTWRFMQAKWRGGGGVSFVVQAPCSLDRFASSLFLKAGNSPDIQREP